MSEFDETRGKMRALLSSQLESGADEFRFSRRFGLFVLEEWARLESEAAWTNAGGVRRELRELKDQLARNAVDNERLAKVDEEIKRLEAIAEAQEKADQEIDDAFEDIEAIRSTRWYRIASWLRLI